MCEADRSAGDNFPALEAILIETAPRDGTVIVALNDLGYPCLVLGDERGFFDDKDGEERANLKWWSPVPAIPRL